MRYTYDMFNDRSDRGRFGDREHSASRVTGASDLQDLTVVLHHETEKAVLVSNNGEEARAVWLPKSRVEIERKESFVAGRKKNGQSMQLPWIVLTLPGKLAIEKRLM